MENYFFYIDPARNEKVRDFGVVGGTKDDFLYIDPAGRECGRNLETVLNHTGEKILALVRKWGG